MNRFALVGLVMMSLCAAALAADKTSENDARLKRALERNPKADGDGDGVLTHDEARAFFAKQKKKTSKPRGTQQPMAAAAGKLYEKRELKNEDGKTLRYFVMKPASGKKQKFPLVVCLHGRGGNTTAASVLAGDKMRKDYPCYVIAPVSRSDRVWAVPEGVSKLKGEHALPLVFDAIDKLKEEFSDIDFTRVYVTGQSMGGFGSFGAVSLRPYLFAAAAPICGGWSPKEATRMKGTAFWVFHGADDKTVPVDRSRDMVAALKKAGATTKYSEYKGVGHGSWSRAYADAELWKWMFNQKRAKN